MDKKILIIVTSVTVVFLAIAAVTAYNRATDTPLYTVRMEQASSKMNFLPTAVNGFTYTAEKGYTLNYGIQGYGGAKPLEPHTKVPPCETWETCDPTCPNTCAATCPNTCPATCPDTCDGPTCPSTCDDPTCYVTSCGEYTCSGPNAINNYIFSFFSIKKY